MNAVIISYSLTGNNQALATSLAKKINARHFQITEPQPRTITRTILDNIFNRSPRISGVDLSQVNSDDFIIFIGPVWLGNISTPFRSCLKYFRNKPNKHAFVTISGGALGPNNRLTKELEKRLNRKPIVVMDLLIAKIFLPQIPKPTSEETSNYRLTQKDIQKLTDLVFTQVFPVIQKEV